MKANSVSEPLLERAGRSRKKGVRDSEKYLNVFFLLEYKKQTLGFDLNSFEMVSGGST